MSKITILVSLGMLFSGFAAAEETDAESFPISTTVSSQFRMLAVVDEDPANDQQLIYGLRAKGRFFVPQATAFIASGVTQAFVAEEGESAFRLRDTHIGFSWKTALPLDNDEKGLKLKIVNTISVFTPTSRISRKQTLYAAPQFQIGFGLAPTERLSLSLAPRFRYRIHRYAERAGTAGAMNVQMDTGFHVGFDYMVVKTKHGGLALGGSAGTTYIRKYDSRDDYLSDTSDRGVWLQSYDWEAHLGYDVHMFSLGLGIEHGGNVLRGGVVNTFFTHRDATQFVMSVAATL